VLIALEEVSLVLGAFAVQGFKHERKGRSLVPWSLANGSVPIQEEAALVLVQVGIASYALRKVPILKSILHYHVLYLTLRIA
jgi:hypothetical protein